MFPYKSLVVGFVELPPIQTSAWTLRDNRLSILWNDGPIVPEDLASILKDPQPETSSPVEDADPLEEADPDDNFHFEDDDEVIDSEDDSDDEDWNDDIDESDTDDDE